MTPLSDSTTDAVIGVSRVREVLRPYSEAGQRSVGDLPTFRGGDRKAWTASIDQCIQVERWWSSIDPEPAREALDQLPTMERPLRLLDGVEPLDDVALFEVKRFLYWATKLVEAVDGAVDRVPIDWEHRLRDTMAALHPEREASPRFHLSAQLDERLGPSRQRLKKARAEHRSRRRDLEQAIVADLGGKFDVRGRFLAGDTDPGTDARLLSLGAGLYELADDRIQELREAVDAASADTASVESDVRARLTAALRGEHGWLADVQERFRELDLTIARVELRERWNGTWGAWRDDGITILKEGRLPRFIETLNDDEIQPISVELSTDPTVVTGPNMGGKSALLQLVAICQWCAQHALPVPATRFEFTPVESMLYVGAEEPGGEGGTGLSAFGREVRRVVEGRSTAAPRLWLLDEFGRGTHPEEGAAIARRLIESLEMAGDRLVFATHFPSLAALNDVVHLRIAGLTHPEKLRSHPDVLDEIEHVLRSAMDFRPIPAAPDEEAVPRDARLVAEVLGLSFD